MADAVSIAGKPAAFTAMPAASRVALVNFALTLARTFAESDEFKRRYADHPEANGPEPVPEEQTADGIFAKQRAAQVRQRELAMKELQGVYPAGPRAPVALRLRKFLDLSRDVAYDAQIVEKGGKRVFADPALEARAPEWKMCFRAGKPATDAARAFAQKWLNDLQAQGVK